MNYQTLNLIATILLSLTGLFLIIAVLIFLKFRIISVIGDLTGRTARKQIEKIRVDNESSGNKGHRPNAFNLERGSLTDEVDLQANLINTGGVGNASKIVEMAHPSKRLDIKENTIFEQEVHRSMATDKLPIGNSLDQNYETTMLSDGIDVLSYATDVLSDVTNGTDILSKDNGTDVLNPTDELNIIDTVRPVDFKIIKSVIFTHTEEVIS